MLISQETDTLFRGIEVTTKEIKIVASPEHEKKQETVAYVDIFLTKR